MASDGTTESDMLRDEINEFIHSTVSKMIQNLGTKASSEIDTLALKTGPGLRHEVRRLMYDVHQCFDRFETKAKEVVRKELHLNETYDFKKGRDVSPSERPANRPSLMMRKFLQSDEAEIHIPDASEREAIAKAARESKEYYFFYGSLMDPKTLQSVLQLEEKPMLTNAMVIGYTIKMWGPYPALLDGDTGEIVHGVVYEVEGSESKDRLEAYETSRYRTKMCSMSTADGRILNGSTFIWDGDVAELKEGTFDLKDWQQDHVLDT